MRKKRLVNKILAWILAVSITSSALSPIGSVSAEEPVANSTQETVAGTQSLTENQPQETPETEEAAPENEMQSGVGTDLYKDGNIQIYNESQLRAIGSGQQVHAGDAKEDTFGTGAVLTNENGTVLTYGMDTSYHLMNDIPLDVKNLWTLPEGFTGKFTGNGEASEEDVLYDSKKDTIYVYHSYQLAVMMGENADEEPVMSKDMIAEEFGIGQLVYKDGSTSEKSEKEAQEYLTYSGEHQYILSAKFTEKMPELKAEMMKQGTAADDQVAGRQHVGQVYTEINGEKYILIGNEQQLRAIGSGKQVAPMLFVRTEVKFLIGVINKVTIIPYYPGDADLNVNNIDEAGIKYSDIDEDTKGFQYLKQGQETVDIWGPDFEADGLLEGVIGVLENVLEGILSILGSSEQEIVGLKNENTSDPSIGADKNDGILGSGEAEYVSFNEIKKQYQGLKYTSDANYIIFRDIDLSANGEYSDKKDDPWTPLAFSGTMIGAKDMAGVTDRGVNDVDNQTVTISGAKIEQKNSTIDPEKTSQRGTGFFSSVGADAKFEGKNITSGGETKISNICLSKISVENKATAIKDQKQGLLTGLLDILNKLVLDKLLSALGLGSVSDLVDRLANGAKDPTMLATGTFAGRVYGDVEITDCSVQEATISSQSSMTGGFAGSVDGVAEYEIVGDLTQAITSLLQNILDQIPYLGAGDLVGNLLGAGVLDVNSLRPTGYPCADDSRLFSKRCQYFFRNFWSFR